MASFRRKVYGRVRPVPKLKPKAPIKPSTLELKAIFKAIQTSPDWKTLDHISEALLWWQGAMKYVNFMYAKKQQSLETAQAMCAYAEAKLKGNISSVIADKEKHYIKSLQKIARWAAPVLKTPDITLYLKKSKEVQKKTVAINKVLTVKYDKILTLLSQCFGGCSIMLKVVAEIDGGLPRRFDHALGTMYYSRSHVNDMKSTLHKQGILALVISEAVYIARGMSFLSGESYSGTFIVDKDKYIASYIQLLNNFEQFAATDRFAPKTLVRRPKKVAVKKLKEDMSWVKGTNKPSRLGPLSAAIKQVAVKKVGYKPGARALKQQEVEYA